METTKRNIKIKKFLCGFAYLRKEAKFSVLLTHLRTFFYEKIQRGSNWYSFSMS